MVEVWQGANNTTFKTGYLECECCCNNHVLRFYTTADDEEDTIYVDVVLNPKHNFIKRLLLGIRYIFNFGSEESCGFECGLIMKKDIDKFINILNEMR